MKKTNFKISTILLYAVLGLSLVHLTFLLLSLLEVLVPSFLKDINFNYIVAFVLVAICLLLYVGLMFIEKIKKLAIPEWFKILFYVGFYVFTNIYYFFGLYSSLVGLIVFYIYLAFVLNIISLSIYFNTQKSETNILKTSTTNAVMSTFAYSVTSFVIVETIISAFKLILAKNGAFSTLSMLVIDVCIGLFVSLVMAIFYALSLNKSKRMINGCLIKIYK